MEDAQGGSEDREALETQFDAVTECGENRRWRHRPTL